MIGKSELLIESLGAHRLPDKLAGAGIEVLSAQKIQKNAIVLQVRRKDLKKVFAILRGSCYNVKRVRARGGAKVLLWCKKSAGVLAGIALFCAIVLFCESRVLKIEIAGSGAYYRTEITEILARNGVKPFSAPPKDVAAITAEILSLPRVGFCSVGKRGGVVTVTVEVSDESAPLQSLPLLSPADGVVEELVVVRGTPLVKEGDEVSAGETLVSNRVGGESGEREIVVIARVRVRAPFSAEYPLESEEAARLQAALDYGEIVQIHTEKTENGWRVSGEAVAEAAVNLG